jgi:hypothetical protein
MTGSRDFVAGSTHAGVSAVEIGNWGDEYLKRRLREYDFLRMKDPKIRPYLYSGKQIGIDSDGYALLDPSTIKEIGQIDIEDIGGQSGLGTLGLMGATGAAVAGAPLAAAAVGYRPFSGNRAALPQNPDEQSLLARLAAMRVQR